ncbi:MAG TPA: UDP-glucose/GDP-mannose dehydrogenase family protein [Pseudonocardiaceae bacterium]|jgi:UDPglucose 6-dehydrogenase|nr:UDP-glucose/GDP-mannose dehydrogenase family protein [Pseudonocardiaceae bacterium]
MARRISVIGTGYLGVSHAVGMAVLGHEVIGRDVDRDRIAALSQGRIPFYEPGLESLLREQLATGRLSFTTSLAEVAEFADVHFVCVGTPQRANSFAADTSFVEVAVETLARYLRRPSLVVGKSTVPVGTADRLAERLAILSPVGHNAELAWNPEFLREGFAIKDTLTPERLVFGVRSDAALDTLCAVYLPLIEAGTPVVATDFPTAELVKVAANAFLATKISFINAMAEVCEAAGGDVGALATALAHDSRIGSHFLAPGLGFGGGCLPKDIRAFIARADEIGAGRALTFLKEVDAINARRRHRTVAVARELCGGSLRGRKVAIWGAAFKPNSDDIRDSPALDVAEAIRKEGGHVVVHDPKATDNARLRFPALDYAPSALDAAAGADLVLHLTEWPEFRELEPHLVAAVVGARRILDARGGLDAAAWRGAGWTYRALGQASPSTVPAKLVEPAPVRLADRPPC